MLSPIPIIFGKKRLLKTDLFPQNSFCMIKQAFFFLKTLKDLKLLLIQLLKTSQAVYIVASVFSGFK